MKKAEFIALSASTMMLTALGIDIMLPVFAAVREHFNLEPGSNITAQIIVFFFLGQIAQIIFGVLTDRFGRKAILNLGFLLYIVGGIAATFSPSIFIMLVWRFIAGMGASAVLMTTIAGVRDRFVGDQMAKTMSLIFTIFLSTPVFAPFLGLAILSVASWQMVFLTPPLFATIVLLWSLRLEETLAKENRISLRWDSILKSVKTVISNTTFLRYIAITTLLFAVLSSWVASSEHIVSEIYKRPELFAWAFASIGLWMAFCTLINSRLSIRFGARRSLKWLLSCYVFIAGILLLYSLSTPGLPNMIVFLMGVALLLGLNLAIEPNSSSLAMEPMGAVAGVASSVYGTIFFFFGALLGSLISSYMVVTVLPMIISFFAFGLLALLLAIADRKN